MMKVSVFALVTVAMFCSEAASYSYQAASQPAIRNMFEREGCKGPEEFENGSYEPIKDTYDARDRIWFNCDDSYRLVGQQDPNCLPSGEWTSDFPTCEPLPTCDSPKQPLGGVFAPSLEIYNVGDVVTFACLNDLRLVGPRSTICLPSKWSHQAPTCEEREGCKGPEDFENGSYEPIKDTYDARDRIWFNCDVSYRLVGQQDPACLSSGEWTSDFPSCEPRPTCEPPTKPLGGAFSPSLELYNVGDVVTFTCLNDRKLIGTQSIICLPGKWSHQVPTCKEREGCKGPEEFENGSYEPIKDTYDARDRIWFNCDVSYRLVGQQDPACLPSGEWTSDFPTCERRPTCGTPRQLLGGVFAPSLELYNVGDVVTFTCLNDRQLVGNRSIVCLPGRWSNRAPTCKDRGCFPPQRFQNGVFEPDYPSFHPGERLWFICNDGYKLNGPKIVSCVEPGFWSGRFPFCDRSVATTCRRPRRPINGAVEPATTRSYRPNDSVRFSCKRDFSLVGASTAICLETGLWSHDVPTCRYNSKTVTCRRLQRPANCFASPEKSEYRVGDAITFACKRNYELIGAGLLICRPAGAWSDDVPICRRNGAPRRVTCGHPTQPRFGYYRPRKQTFYVGDRIIYSCSSGYLIGVGSRTTSCLSSGHWSQHTPIRCFYNNNTCRRRCGNYDSRKPCQCHRRCRREGNCCKDYHHECA